MIRHATLADAIKHALAQLAQAVKLCASLLNTTKQDNAMWSSNILDYPAHWLMIAHNSRNNKRTKPKRNK